MRLNICCSDHLLPAPDGWVNVDLAAGLPASWSPEYECQIVDLDEGWPWRESSVDEIRAYDAIEHLRDPVKVMNRAWFVLGPGGRLDIKVPTTDGPGAWQDPTHRSFWNRNSFLYYTDGAAEWMRFRNAYGITARFRVVSTDHIRHNNGVVDLNIILEAVK